MMGGFIGQSGISRGGFFGSAPSSGPPFPTTWVPRLGVSFPFDDMNSVAIFDSLHAVCTSHQGNYAYTADGGVTWTVVPAGLLTGCGCLVVSNGGVLVGTGSDGSGGETFRSSDNGVTITDTTAAQPVPPGIVGTMFYSPTFNLFYAFDTSFTHKTYSTADGGLTWNSHAISTDFSNTFQLSGDGMVAELGGVVCAAGNSNAAPGPSIAHSTDAVSWTIVPPLVPNWFQMGLCSNGTKFLDIAFDNVGTNQRAYTSTDGATWSLASSSAIYANPPFSGTGPVAFGSNFVTLSRADFLTIGYSPDGASWTTVTPPFGATLSPTFLHADSQALYLLGNGGLGITRDLATFTQPIVLASGLINSVATGHGLYFAVGTDDAGNGQLWQGI